MDDYMLISTTQDEFRVKGSYLYRRVHFNHFCELGLLKIRLEMFCLLSLLPNTALCPEYIFFDHPFIFILKLSEGPLHGYNS